MFSTEGAVRGGGGAPRGKWDSLGVGWPVKFREIFISHFTKFLNNFCKISLHGPYGIQAVCRHNLWPAVRTELGQEKWLRLLRKLQAKRIYRSQ
jgi:hypothetical protein